MSDFQKRHYEQVAKVIREALGDIDEDISPVTAQVLLAHEFADLFKKDNSNFDYRRFGDAIFSDDRVVDTYHRENRKED